MRLVSLDPSSPARGESFTLKVTAMVGGSIGRAASAVVQSGCVKVSATPGAVKDKMSAKTKT